MRQIIIDFGTLNIFGANVPVHVYGYGLMMVLGFLAAILLAQWRARRVGENPEVVVRCGILALISGILGARLAYIIQHWDMFANDEDTLAAVMNITSGGLIYYGGVILATIVVLAYLYAKKVPVRRYLDIVAVSLMVGLAFGRAGCLLNGCCYGGRCGDDWPLGMRFPMYSKPLVKLDNTPGAFSWSVEGPSPVYEHQLDSHPRRVKPDERLLGPERFGRRPRLPRDLHGKLETDQLAVLLDDPPGEVQRKFNVLAGPGRKISHEQWRQGLKRGDGFLRGSEQWDEAMQFDANRDGLLDFKEASAYLQWRRQWVLQRFGGGRDRLSEDERRRANAYLQADLFSLAEAQWSMKVKPAQVLGIVNALLLAGLGFAFYRLRSREGQVFALVAILYPITRFIEEAIRDDNPHDILKGILTHNQYTSLALAIAGVGMYIVLYRVRASAGPAWAARLAAAEALRAAKKPRNEARK